MIENYYESVGRERVKKKLGFYTFFQKMRVFELGSHAPGEFPK